MSLANFFSSLKVISYNLQLSTWHCHTMLCSMWPQGYYIMHEQAPMNDSVSETKKRDLVVFPPTTASNMVTAMILVLVFGCSRVNFLHYRIYNQVHQRVSIFCLSCFSYIFLLLKVLIIFQSAFCRSSIQKEIVKFEFFIQKYFYKK